MIYFFKIKSDSVLKLAILYCRNDVSKKVRLRVRHIPTWLMQACFLNSGIEFCPTPVKSLAPIEDLFFMQINLLILVAVVQGLTEFLPVSSSGHLVLIPVFSNFSYQGHEIDVAAHVGTLIAVSFYLRNEIIASTRGAQANRFSRWFDFF